MNDLSPRLAREFLDEMSRQSLARFVERTFPIVSPGDALRPNWHHELIAHEVSLAFAGDQRRLAISIMPRALKSIVTSVCGVAWALGHNPALQVICASYSLDLALKLARDCRRLMQSETYRRIFPRTHLDPHKQGEQEFLTTRGGGRFTTSIGGTLTGRGGDVIILDDLMNAKDAYSKAARDTAGEWIDLVARSRLNDPVAGSIIIVGQRLHEDDPIGRIMAKERAFWRFVEIPAIAEQDETHDLGRGRIHLRKTGEALEPGRVPLVELEATKAAIGTAEFNAQYQQKPVPEEGNLVQRAWLRRGPPPPRTRQDRVVQSWDTAIQAGQGNDYSVCITALIPEGKFKGCDIHILEVYRQRLTYPQLKRMAQVYSNRWSPNIVLVEAAASGISLVQDLRDEGIVRPKGIRPVGDKVSRLSFHSAKLEQGRIWIPEEAKWADDFISELISFPSAKHDDQVDALTQLLAYVDERNRWRTTQTYF